MTPFEPGEGPMGLLNPTGSVVDGETMMSKLLRRYFSDFAVSYIQEEVRHTGKPLGTVVEEVLRVRVSFAQLGFFDHGLLGFHASKKRTQLT